jgi:acyl-CoA synthetase (AMP-forming)/AMP-acid ligase II
MVTTGPWPSQAPYPKHPFSRLLEQSAQRLPDKPALIDIDEKPYTFRTLWEAARKTARFLQQQANVTKGDTVAIHAPNCPEYAVALHGLLLLPVIVAGLAFLWAINLSLGRTLAGGAQPAAALAEQPE